MTLGPVSFQASLVTLKMPAPIRIPINAAYDSTVPRSRRRRETIGKARLFLSVLLVVIEGGIRVSYSHPVSTGCQFPEKSFQTVFNGFRPFLLWRDSCSVKCSYYQLKQTVETVFRNRRVLDHPAEAGCE